MPPSPGDPHLKPPANITETSGSADSPNVMVSNEMEARFKAILNMNDYNADQKAVQDAVLYWKHTADCLKVAGYPLFAGKSNTDAFEEEIKLSALHLDEFLDKLITKASLSEESLYQKLRVLIAEGETYDTFKKKMKDLDYSLKCNAIWENDSVAYRCNTCALTPCMSLCADCFQNNGHAGHDFTRFFSREGGACDCGNPDVIKPEGFCCRHGEEAVRPPDVTPVTVSLAEYIIMKIFVRLFISLRGFSRRFTEWKAGEESEFGVEMDLPNMSTFCELEVSQHKLAIEFLQECVNYGGPMREAMSCVLLNKSLYTALTEREADDVLSADVTSRPADVALDWRVRHFFEDDRRLLLSEQCKAFFPQTADPRFLECKSLLHELLIWTIVLNFPQNVINLCLSMLSEPDYLTEFSCRFFTWYPVIANCMGVICEYQHRLQAPRTNAVQNTGSRIIHVSVQMLSSGVLSEKLDKSCDLVHVVLQSSLFLISEAVLPTKMRLDPELQYSRDAKEMKDVMIPWNVLDLEKNRIVAEHGYWFVMGDIQNLLSHASLATAATRHPKSFRSVYIRLISIMQGMNLNWRIVEGEHRELDAGEPVHRSFTLEFETLAITMFNFVSAVVSKQDFMGAIIYFDFVKKALEDWLMSICVNKIEETRLRMCPAFNVSFHLPLHRHLSTALTHFCFMPRFRDHISDFSRNEKLLRLIYLHPMRIQVARAEYAAGMWVRNGQQLRVQSILYAQPHINMSFHTPDIDLIRFCAANINSEWFIASLFDSFHLYDVLRMTELADDVTTDQPVEGAGDSRTFSDEDLSMDHDGETAASSESDGKGSAFERMLDTLSSVKDPNTLRRVFLAMSENRKLMGSGSSDISTSAVAKVLCQSEVPVLQYNWLGEEGAKVLKRTEWVDQMLSAALRLLTEIVVIRLNCGATQYESMRAEMVNELTQDSHTFSKLRGSLPEKGSRGAPAVDKEFDGILEQIADFSEPDSGVGGNGQMRQGTYVLKKEVWLSDFCPVMCHMRALTPRYSSAVLRKMETIDRESLGGDQRGRVDQFWTPYRLSRFDPALRQESVRDVAKILLTERFIQMAILTVVAVRKGGVQESCLQLTVYLLTLAVQYAATLSEEERQTAFSEMYRNYKIETAKEDESIPSCSVFTLLFHSLLLEVRKKKSGKIVLEKILNGEYAQERVIGGFVEYVGRYLSLLAKSQGLARVLISAALRDFEREEEEARAQQSAQEPSTVPDRKLLAKRRREAMLAATQKKNQKVMQKMMEREGMTQQDVDNIDTTKPDVRLYECPICGDSESPSTLKQPMGLLVRVGENPVASMCVASEVVVPSLLDADAGGNGETKWNRKTKKSWNHARKELTNLIPQQKMVDNPCSGTEIKTCGHTAHIQCFNSYRETVHHSELRVMDVAVSKRVVGCPMCRFSVNAQLPMRVDWGFETSSRGDLERDTQKAFYVLSESVLHWQKEFVNDEEDCAFGEHYGVHLAGVFEKVKWDGFPKGQSCVVSLIKSHIERNIVFDALDVPERRKNTRSVILEHLLPAAVAKTSPLDEQLSVHALRDMLLPTIENEEQPSASEKRTEDLPTDEDLMSCTALNPDELLALRMTPVRPKFASPKSLSKMSATEFKAHLGSTKSSVPILFFDHRSLLIRLACFVLDNRDLSTEDKKQLCRLLVVRLASLHAVRTAVCLFQRVSQHVLVQQALSEKKAGDTPYECLLNGVARSLAANTSNFEAMLSQLSTDDVTCISLPNACSTLEQCVRDFLLFSARFLREAGCPGDSQDVAEGVDYFSYFHTDASSLVPTEPMLAHWIKSFLPVIGWNYKSPSQVLCREPLTWKPFTLLELPDSYDAIFSRFFRRSCISCSSVPSSPFVCMSCAQLVCLDECCNIKANAQINEVDRHAWECGGGVGVFLAVSNAVVVVAGKGHGAIWGSVYLDSHGEEDRNLRRGKPLYLSEKRMQCLRRDWAEQEWSRTSQWMALPTLFNQLKDAHFHVQR